MVLELADEEVIKFRQPATVDKMAGQLLVTNIRVHWSSVSGQSGGGLGVPDFQTPWANVTRVQYCEPLKMKGKAGIKLDMSSGAKLTVMCMLTSADRAVQLETLKSIVKDVHKPSATAVSATAAAALLGLAAPAPPPRPLPPPPPAPIPGVGFKRKATAGQAILARNTDNAVSLAKLQERRKELLAADVSLARFHKDLCQGKGPGGVSSAILTEEEFWEAHMPEYASHLYQRDGDDFTQKGRLPLKARIAAGIGGLKLTRDDIMLILEEDPITRRAHADLVPHQKSETEFWQLYINKYYHRSDRSGQADQVCTI